MKVVGSCHKEMWIFHRKFVQIDVKSNHSEVQICHPSKINVSEGTALSGFSSILGGKAPWAFRHH